MNSENGESFHRRLAELIGGEKPFEWAKRCGIPSGTFSRIWTEKTIPKSEHIIRISEFTGATIDWLLLGLGPSHRGNTPVQTEAVIHIDSSLLSAIIRLIEEWLAANHRHLDSAKKAELAATLYEIATEEAAKAGGEARVEPRTVERFLRLVA